MVLSSELLAGILEEVRPLLGQGKVADYIPALAQVPADRLGIAVCTVEGELFTAGDAFEPFSIQSISKALSLTATRHGSLAAIHLMGSSSVSAETSLKTPPMVS